MEQFLLGYLGEAVIVVTMALVGLLLRNTSTSNKEVVLHQLTEMDKKIDELGEDFHDYKLHSEHRLTRLETKAGILNGKDEANKQLHG